MVRRRIVLGAAVLSFLSPARASGILSDADRADIVRVQDYLRGIRTLKARFTQTAQDGGVSAGTAWLERPGRMRFQYDPPSPFLLIASHGVLTFNDSSLQQTSNIPLSRTPLGILLSPDASLSGAVTVTDVARTPGQLQVSLMRTGKPDEGSLTLVFREQPPALAAWILVDAQRRETRVVLSDIQTGGVFDQALFEQLSPPAARG